MSVDEKLETFGRNLNLHRRVENLTLRDMQDLTGIAISHLSAIERGIRIPSLRYAIVLSDVFGLTVDEMTREWALT